MQKTAIKGYGLNFSSLTRRPETDLFVIHHTGNSGDDDLSAKEIHQSHLNLGWAGIGYHYVIRKDGTIEEGRPQWTIGSHAYGENRHSIGIHFSGNFEINSPTSEQIEGGALLLAKLGMDYRLPLDKNHVVGHRDLMATACPGKNLSALLQTLRGKGIWYQQEQEEKADVKIE